MKLHHIFTLSLGIALISCSEVEQDETPNAVLQSFSSMFPNAKEVEWEKEDDHWEAEFEKDGMEVSVEFENDGDWISTETELDKTTMPHEVAHAISEKYPNCQWEKFEEVRKENFMAYEVDIVYEGQEIEILISGSGEILDEKMGDKKEEEKEEA